MPGKFECAPRWGEYFWSLVIDGGIGTDEVDDDNCVRTTVPLAPEDRELYPDLPDEWTAVVLWEDDQGFVYCEGVRCPMKS